MLLEIAGEPSVAYSETLQWTDENGAVGFTDNVLAVPPQERGDVVPRQSRESARSFAVPPRNRTTGVSQDVDATFSESAPSESKDGKALSGEDQVDPRRNRDYWRERIQVAKAKVEELRAERLALEQKLDESTYGMWLTFGPGASNLEQREEMPNIEQDIKELDHEIERLENEVTMVIPREARRAGVPPGWLR